jgi:hypothetical protein
MKRILLLSLIFTDSLIAQSSGVGSNWTTVTGTLQSAATSSTNGSTLAVQGLSSAMVTVNCSVACSGGTTITFQVSQDGTNFSSVYAQQAGSSIISSAVVNQGTTPTLWQINVAGAQLIRAPISGYSAGTVTVTATATAIPFTPSAQTGGTLATGTVTTSAGSAVQVPFSGMGCVGIVLSGTWTGTLAAQQSNDGTNWQPADLLQQLLGKWPESTGSNGRYYSGGYSAQFFRMAGPVGTGTASVSLQTSAAPCNQYVFSLAGAEAGNGLSAVAATGTQTSVADLITGYNSADVQITWSGITGSPSGCTVQAQGSGNGTTFTNVGPAQAVTAGTAAMLGYAGPFGLAVQFIYACSVYPSAGTITMSQTYKTNGATVSLSNYGTSPGAVPVPAVNTFTTNTVAHNLTQISGNNVLTATTGVQKVGVSGNTGAPMDQAPGSAIPTNALQMGMSDGTNTRVPFLDPCGFQAWTYFPINVAANTQVVAGSSGKNVYVCKMFLAPVAAAANVNIVESATSGNACATSPTGMLGGATAALGAQLAVNGGFVLPADQRGWAKTATSGDAICIFASAQVTGVLAYVQF